MKVAIIGAGLAGLSAALTLEKEGVPFDIFEARHMCGELFHHSSAMLQIMNRPIKDPIKHLNKAYGLQIQPLAPLRTIVMRTPHTESTIRGNLGYLFKRGQDPDSLEQQLFKQLKTSVTFQTYADWQTLKEEYDHLIICDGVKRISNEIGCWTDTFQSWVKGATILGEFDPNTLIMWLNTNYCKAGYAYLTPFSHNRAFIGLVVPNSTPQELTYFWDLFIRMENIKNEIVDSFEVRHAAGHVFPHQKDNMLLAGIAGGFQDPFLGFGQFGALSTGALAAISIARRKNYSDLVKPLANEIKNLVMYRDRLDVLTNHQFDLMVKTLGFPVLNQLIYNTNINAFKLSGALLNIYSGLSKRIKQKSRT